MARPSASRTRNGPRSSQRDSLDFRDWIYQPALIPLPEDLLPKKGWMHILDQGKEGACTGFGLAAVVNYLIRARGGKQGERVSPRMLYEMAKRHDRWPGYRYDGSTARGAMKGWYKNGASLETDWPYTVDDPGRLSDKARLSALRYPLGAFYRILPKRSDVHGALNEAHGVFATAATHKGWDDPEDGLITHETKWAEQGGHAFAIVGYTDEGFLIQNSWGKDWGGVDFGNVSYPGCAIWSYGDFDRNVWDLWVARLARPVESISALTWSTERRAEYSTGTPPARRGPARHTIENHYIHIDDGQFDPHGDYPSSELESKRIIHKAVHAGSPHILLYAHGGGNGVKDAAKRVGKWNPVFEANGIYEVHFIWETGILAELLDIILGKEEFVKGRAGGPSDWSDWWFERATGPVGRGLWSEMRSDAELAFDSNGDGVKVLQFLLDEMSTLPAQQQPKLHLVGHSAGAVFLGRLLSRWAQLGAGVRPQLENLILLAPACTHAFFESHIKPPMVSRDLDHLYHFLLDDQAEQDDQVALLYRKSILYLVSRAYQKKGQVVPIMGMQIYLKDLPTSGISNRVKHYNPVDHPNRTASKDHGHFDNDPVTMNSMLRLVLGHNPTREFTQSDLDIE